MFTFSDLKRFTKKTKTNVENIASDLGLSYDGLKLGLDQQTLKIQYVLPLCKILCISPDQFFDVETPKGDIVYGDQQKGSKMKIKKDSPELAHAIEILQEELRQKNEQLAAKDRTIAEKDQQIADINKQLLSKILAL